MAGTVSSGDCQIALDGNSTGSVIVDGISSTLNIDSYLYVGGIGIGDNPSKGTLEITNGGTVNSGGCDIAFYRGESTGSVIVDGIGSTLNIDSYLNIGGTGIVNNHGKDTLENYQWRFSSCWRTLGDRLLPERRWWRYQYGHWWNVGIER